MKKLIRVNQDIPCKDITLRQDVRQIPSMVNHDAIYEEALRHLEML